MAEPNNNNNNNNRRQFIYDGGPQTAGEVRNCLLVVAALVATVTFQAAASPPGGVWGAAEQGNVAAAPGKSVFATVEGNKKSFYAFLICNTLAFSSSICIIQYLTQKFPLYAEVLMAVVGMAGSYIAAVIIVSPESEYVGVVCSLGAAFIVTQALGLYLAFGWCKKRNP